MASNNVHTYRWLNYFTRTGHEVHLVISEEPYEDIDHRIKIHRLRLREKGLPWFKTLENLWRLESQLKKVIRQTAPDILHAHTIEHTAILGALSGFRPFVATAWGSDILIAPQKSAVRRLLVRYALRHADLLTCDTEHIRDRMVDLGAEPPKINIIKFGVDVDEFKPAPREEGLAQELNIGDSPAILSLRRLEALYDIETIIKAIPQVVTEVPRAKFVFLGEGSQRAMLEEMAKSLGVAGNVRFAGAVPAKEVPRYLNAADICVSTALSDAGPGGIIEAMSCELPVITTDFGDNRKWVEDGANGFIIPPRSPDTLAARIITLLKDKSLRERFGKANRQIIMERNNWAKEMAQMEKLYLGLVRKKGGRS
ncbi:MAG: glycosyltransferase family 4 protein [Dehalococcoidales bacterium]|nr:glycosyltransferase family 4 protein [Dehalococcoidales bacterium]